MVRRYPPFVLLTLLGCSSQSVAPNQETTAPMTTMQAPQMPQKPQQTAATSGSGGAAQMPQQPAKMDAAMPMQMTQPTMPTTPSAGMGGSAAVMTMPTMPTTPSAGMGGAAAAMTMPTDAACAPRKVEGPTGMFFHHVHFNTTDPSADLAFFEKHFDAESIDFCTKPGGAPATKASKVERGYFLYTKVATPPDPTLNAYLEHIGWCHQDPVMELQRQAMLGAPLWKADTRGQCDTAAAGTRPCNDYWFYMQAPSGAKIEIALGPGPATMGFGHVHVIMGEDLSWYEKVSGGKYKDTAIDMVNITDVLEDEMYLSGQMVTDTRGKPIDHIAFSTTNLMAERDRIKAAGVMIAEDISDKPEYGFKSFFVKSAKGIWLEIVEDSAFAP